MHALSDQTKRRQRCRRGSERLTLSRGLYLPNRMMMTGNGFPAMGGVLIVKTSVLFAPFKGETRASFRMMVMRKHDDQQKEQGGEKGKEVKAMRFHWQRR